MEVTRREMLTAASAVGVTAALAQGQAAAALQEQKETDARVIVGAWKEDDVVEGHFSRAVRLIKRSSPKVFKYFTKGNLIRFVFDENGTRIPGHRIRGFYKDSEFDQKNKLSYVYAYSYEENAPRTCHFLAVGSVSRDARRKVRETIEEIIADLQEHREDIGIPTLTFPDIPTALMKDKSFLSKMLRYLASNQDTMDGVSFTKNTPPTNWTLELTRP
ncbi:hypothetical protein Pan258_31810 [Symmachiella dynata]|uniref:hypothetical protein n=1 Tax=Symmachiella dynata TaxID=2527995 RepID=UPI0011895203|nr:hypothetical protein [Symmachiella dynata]QDT49134.1 hypothetical protein Pan258_31810 [Symmachiella dynata]